MNLNEIENPLYHSIISLIANGKNNEHIPHELDIEFIKNMNDLLWLVQNDEIEYSSFIPKFMYYKKYSDQISDDEFIGLTRQIYSKGLLDGVNTVFIFYFIESVTTVAELMKSALSLRDLLNIGYPNPEELIYYLQEYTHAEVDSQTISHYQKISRSQKLLRTKPSVFFEHLNEYSQQFLSELTDWVDAPVKSQLIKHMITESVSSLPTSTSWEELYKKINSSDTLLKDFPPSFRVFGDKLSKLPKVSLDGDIASNFPPKIAMDLIPKFVFSRPEVLEQIKIYFPGGSHIGHSSILIKTNSGLLLFDFGMSVVNNSIPNWLPYLEGLDAVFVSHAHLDHSGALPLLFLEQKNLPVFMTKETKVISEMLWNDTANILKKVYSKQVVKNSKTLSNLTNKSNILNTLDQTIEIEYGQSINILPNVEIIPHNASHLFGSSMFEIKIGNKSIIYTGDFNADGTVIFPGAKVPLDNATKLIFDGTYYNKAESNEVSNSDKLKSKFQSYDKILIPAFSVGRTQEVLYQLIKTGVPKDWKIKITGMGSTVMKKLRYQFETTPLLKKQLSLNRTVRPDEFIEKTIVIGGHGMLQAGTARGLAEATKDDPNTSILFTGYQAPTSLGFALLNKKSGLNFKQDIDRLKLSGHTSSPTLNSILDDFEGEKIMVHTPKETKVKDKQILTPKTYKN